MKKIFVGVLSFFIFVAFAFILGNSNKGAQFVSAQVANVCPDGGEWTKVDGLSGLTYTFTVPSGFTVIENCMKVGSHAPVFGTGNVVTNTTLFNSPAGVTCTAPGVPHNGCALQSISHASFRLQAIALPSPTPTQAITPTPTLTVIPTPTDTPNENKIIICHRTNSVTNPYNVLEVDQSAADGIAGNNTGQGDHFSEHLGPLFDQNNPPPPPHNGDQWGDIIPPIDGIHGGLNWTAEGQAAYRNECVVVAVTPTVTPTPTPGGGTGGPGPGDGRSDGLSSCPECTKAHNAPAAPQQGEVLGLSTTSAGAGNIYLTYAQLIGAFMLSLKARRLFL